MPDLNLKKSWNPKLVKNRAKVWKREQEVLQQYKKSREREQEIKEIRNRSDLLALSASKNGGVRDKVELQNNYKTEWIYKSEPKDKNVIQSTGSSNDDIMLGRKKLDEMLTKKRNPTVAKSRFDKVVDMLVVNSTKASDKVEALNKEDPLYKIQIAQNSRNPKCQGSFKIQKARIEGPRHNHHQHSHHHHRHHN